MSKGFIYVLASSSNPGLIKMGKTTRNPSDSDGPRHVFRIGAPGRPASSARQVSFQSAVRQEEVF